MFLQVDSINKVFQDENVEEIIEIYIQNFAQNISHKNALNGLTMIAKENQLRKTSLQNFLLIPMTIWSTYASSDYSKI